MSTFMDIEYDDPSCQLQNITLNSNDPSVAFMINDGSFVHGGAQTYVQTIDGRPVVRIENSWQNTTMNASNAFIGNYNGVVPVAGRANLSVVREETEQELRLAKPRRPGP